MSPSRSLSVCFALVFCLAGCADKASDTEASISSPKPISLLAAWPDVQIEQAVAAPEAPARSEVRFDETGVEADWEILQGLKNARAEDGRLQAETSSAQPVIAVDFAQPQGLDDELWSVEIRLKASAGNRVSVHPMAGEQGPPLPVVLGRIEEWPVSSALVSGPDTTTYTVVLDHVFLLEMMPAQQSIERLLIRPTNAADAEIELESVRLVFRKERLASIDSGPGWHGLGEVFREALVSRAPETLAFELDLPARPWLDLSVGTIDSESPIFQVAVAEGDSTETVAELTAESPEQWHSRRVNLGPWAGKRVQLRLTAQGEAGRPAFWAPTIRSSLDPESAAERPQAVVLFLADTLRADHLDAWGYGRPTAPTLKALADEGTRFADTLSQATWTKVSVSSILTSLYPSTTGVAGLHDRISVGETTLAEVLRDAGYATFATSSVPFSGQLTNLHQGVEVMYEYGARGKSSGIDDYRSKTAKGWVDAYMDWLELHHDVPTLALIHAMDPHSPFRPAPPFDQQWATEEDAERFAAQADAVRPHIKKPLMKRFLAPNRDELEKAGVDAESFVRHEKAWYDGSILGMDTQVARILDGWKAHGLSDRALFALVSDHGEEFLEHGEHWHGQTVYGEVTQVPMMLWGQGVPKGVVIDDLAQTIDLMPTMLELMDLPAPERVQGRSWVEEFQGLDMRPLPGFVEHRGAPGQRTSFAIAENRWKLVWYPEEDLHELYDRSVDPLDQNNLASEHPAEVERLAEALNRWQTWAVNQKLDEAEVTSELSAEQLEQLRSLGYVE